MELITPPHLILYVSDLAHPEPQGTLLVPEVDGFRIPVALPIHVLETESFSSDGALYYLHKKRFRKIRLPFETEHFPNLLSSIQTQPLDQPLHVISQTQLVTQVTQSEDMLTSLQDNSLFLPLHELRRLLLSIRSIFIERMSHLYHTRSKRGIACSLNRTPSVPLLAEKEREKPIPPSMEILAIGCPEGKSDFYIQDSRTYPQDRLSVKLLLSLATQEPSPFCIGKMNKESSTEEHLMQEYMKMKRLMTSGIPHILQMWSLDYHKKKDEPPEKVFLTEFCNRGSLSDWEEQDRLQRMTLGMQLALTLKEMHRLHIFHMNLRPENILLLTEENRLSLRLTGFTFSHDINIDGPTFAAPIEPSLYIPPEMKRELAPASPATDLWQLGNILYFLKFGTFPFREIPPTYETLFPTSLGDYPVHLWSFIQHLTTPPQDPLNLLIFDLFSLVPTRRPSAASVAECLAQWIERNTPPPQ